MNKTQIDLLLEIFSSKSITAFESFIAAQSEEVFISILLAKENEQLHKKDYFGTKSFTKIVVVREKNNFENFSNLIAGREIHSIGEEDIKFAIESESNIGIDLNGALAVLTNNNAANIGYRNLIALKQIFPMLVLAVHDYDNHHWVKNSIAIAAICDIYIPAQLDSLSFASKINPTIVHGIPCGSLQWSKKFLHEKKETLITANRSKEPLGKHHFYEKFKLRNQIVSTLNQKYESVCVLFNEYHSKNVAERWSEWVGHKMHFICPVLNDLPIRFFDALLSGGIPIVPKGLMPYLDFLQIPKGSYTVYTTRDVLSPESLVQHTAELFDSKGIDGISERHSLALGRFHVDSILEKIIMECEKIFLRQFETATPP